MPLAFTLRSTVGRTVVTVAGAATIALFAGCGSSGSDSASSGGSGSSSSTAGSSNGQSSNSGGLTATSTGAEIFEAMSCKSCHTLAAENATGVIGPNLDKEKPPVAEIVSRVTNGAGSMPSFKSRLSAAQIQTLAEYVAKVEGS